MVLEAEGISKAFGPTVALRDVSVKLESGKVHALVGENGAGKSTLFKILSAYEQKDSGTIVYNNNSFEPEEQKQAKEAGIVLVMQELTINRSLGISENIFIDQLRNFSNIFGIINRKVMYKRAQSILDEINAEISISNSIDDLDLGQLKIIEVARALSYNPKVILLDESTAYLNTKEITALLNVINSMKTKGIAIGFISHHLDEVGKVADQLTILKDGFCVGVYKADDLTTKEIESLMVGREILFDFSQKNPCWNKNKTIFSIKDVFAKADLKGINLELHEQEILGIGGLKGAGGEAILETIIGERKISSGSMTLNGRSYEPKMPYDSWQEGIGYLPGSRTTEGLIVDFSVQENIIMTKYPRRGFLIDSNIARSTTEECIETLMIKAKNPLLPCSSLSGGNMQKVVLGKCLYPKPWLLLLNNPTRGIDVGARLEIYKTIRKSVLEDNTSVIILSEDLLELINLSDRILIMNRGRIKKEFLHSENPSEEDVISYMI